VAAIEAEKQDLHRQRREIKQVQTHAGQGIMTALYTIVRSWKAPVGIGELARRIPMGPSYVDAAGYELPPEALDANGEPIQE
jgi:hypothetical protein